MTTLTMDGLASTVTKAAEIHLIKGLATICGAKYQVQRGEPRAHDDRMGTKVSGVQSQSYKGKGRSEKSGHSGRCGGII